MTLKIWSLDGVLHHTLIGHSNVPRSVQINGKRIISGSYDQSIIVWGLENGRIERKLRTADCVICLRCSRDRIIYNNDVL
jgi:WD40 repeat protein